VLDCGVKWLLCAAVIQAMQDFSGSSSYFGITIMKHHIFLLIYSASLWLSGYVSADVGNTSNQITQDQSDTAALSQASNHTYSVIDDNSNNITPLAAVLLPAVTKAIAAGMPGIIVYARIGNEEASIAQGTANVAAGTPMRTDHMFRIASNSKTYLAVLIAQLHSLGTFSLDTPIAEILSAEAIAGIANANQVTTRQLLNHTSGVYDTLSEELSTAFNQH
jgi:CubicO group peptidase (beta-lactamase class C family)